MALGDIFGRLVEAISDMMRGSVLAQREALDQLIRTINPEEVTEINRRRGFDIPFDPQTFNELATAIHRTITVLDRTALEGSSIIKQIKQGVANTPFRMGFWHPQEATVASHPDYVRPISPVSDILYMRTGLLSGLKQGPVSPNMENFLGPFIRAGNLLRDAAKEFDTVLELSLKNVNSRILPQEAYVREKAYTTPEWLSYLGGLRNFEHPQFTGADLKTLREVMQRSYYEGGLHQFEQLSAETTRYQFAKGRTVAYLTEYARQLPEKERGSVLALSTEVDRSFNDLIEANAEKLISGASQQISRYIEAFRTVSTIPVGHVNYMTALGYGGLMTTSRQVINWDAVGRVGQELQGVLHNLLQTVALPNRKDEVERYVDSTLQWATQSIVQELYTRRGQLPTDLRTVIESLHAYQGTHEGLKPIISQKEKAYEEKTTQLTEAQEQLQQFKEQFTQLVKTRSEAANITPEEARSQLKNEIKQQITKFIQDQMKAVETGVPSERPLTKLLEEEKPKEAEESLSIENVPPEYNKPKPGEEGRVALEKVENLIDILKEEAKMPISTAPTTVEEKPIELPPVLELPSGIKVPRSWIEKEMPEVLEGLQKSPKQTGIDQILNELQSALSGLVQAIKTAVEQIQAVPKVKSTQTVAHTSPETNEETATVVNEEELTTPEQVSLPPRYKTTRRRTKTRDIARRIKEEWAKKQQQEEQVEDEIERSDEQNLRKFLSDEELTVQAFKEIKERRIKEFRKAGKPVVYELPELQLQEEVQLTPSEVKMPVIRPDFTFMNQGQRDVYQRIVEPLTPTNAAGFSMPLLNEFEETPTIPVENAYMFTQGYHKIQGPQILEYWPETPQFELPEPLVAGFEPATPKKQPKFEFEPVKIGGELLQGPSQPIKSLDEAAEALSNASKAARRLEEELNQLAEEIPQGKAQATQAQIRFSPELQKFLTTFEESVKKGELRSLAKSEPELYDRLVKTLELVRKAGTLKEQVVSGQLPLWTKVREGVITPAYESTRGFMMMNARNFEVAFMFGLSAGVFQALNEIPMRSVYETMTPVFHSVGGLTGLMPFWQEFQQFGAQVPRIVADLQTRMNTIQALMGSRLYAEQAVGSAIQLARVQPIQFPEAMEVLTALSVYPSTKLQAANPQFQQQVFNAVQLLSLLAPEQGIGGALFAIREMLGGQFRSLQMRFNIGPETLAAYAGKTLEQFKGAPGAEKLEILVKALESMFGGEEVLFRKGAQFDVQLRNIGDTLVQAIALPMVTKIQPTFASMVSGLMQLKGTKPTTVEELTQTPFFQSIPQAQSQMLLRIAESRAYTEVESRYSATVINEILRKAGYTPEKIQSSEERAAILLKLDPHLDQRLSDIQRELNKQTVLQSRSLAVNTYGNTTGMLAYMATIFNQTLGPLVNAFSVGSGITRLIGSFAQKFVPQTVEFQERLKYAGTEQQRQQIAVDFLRNFVSDLQSSLALFRQGINSDEFKRLMAQMMSGVRDVIMTAFSPVTEAVMIQTLKTGIELPGKMVGGTAEYLFQSLTTANIPGIVHVMSNLTGVAAGLSMSRLSQGHLFEGVMGVLGFSLLQRGLGELQVAGPTRTGLVETALGLGQVMMLVPSIRTSISTSLRAGMNELSRVVARTSITTKLDSLISELATSKVGQYVRPIPAMVEMGEDTLGIKRLRATYVTPGRLTGALLGVGLAGLEGYQTLETGQTSTQRLLTGLGSVLGIISTGAFMMGRPLIGGAALGLSAVIEALNKLLEHRQSVTRAEVTAGQKVELTKTVVQNELADIQSAVRNRVEATAKTYHLGNFAEQELRKLAMRVEYQPRAYFMSMTERGAVGTQASEAVRTVIEQYKSAGFPGVEGALRTMPQLQQVFGTIEALRLRTYKEARENLPQEYVRMETAYAQLFKQLGPIEYSIAQFRATHPNKPIPVEMKTQEERIISNWMTKYLNPGGLPPTERKHFEELTQKIKEALLDGIRSAQARMTSMLGESIPALSRIQSEVVGPAIARKVMFQQIYSLGIPEIPTIPKRLFETTGGASQLQSRLTQLTGIEQQYMQKAGQFFGSTLGRALSLGVISPKEYEDYRLAFAHQFIQHLRKGLIGPQLGLQLLYQFSPEIGRLGELKEVQQLLNKSLARTTVEQLAKGYKLEVELSKVHVNTQGIDEAINKLKQAILSGAISISQVARRAYELMNQALSGKLSVKPQTQTTQAIEEQHKQAVVQHRTTTTHKVLTPTAAKGLEEVQEQIAESEPLSKPLTPAMYKTLTPQQQKAVRYYLKHHNQVEPVYPDIGPFGVMGTTSGVEALPPHEQLIYKLGKSIVGTSPEQIKAWNKVVQPTKPASTQVTPTAHTSLLNKIIDFFEPSAMAAELPRHPVTQVGYHPLSVNSLHTLVRQTQPVHEILKRIHQFIAHPAVQSVIKPFADAMKPLGQVMGPMLAAAVPEPIKLALANTGHRAQISAQQLQHHLLQPLANIPTSVPTPQSDWQVIGGLLMKTTGRGYEVLSRNIAEASGIKVGKGTLPEFRSPLDSIDVDSMLPQLSKAASALGGFEAMQRLSTQEDRTPLWNPETMMEAVKKVEQGPRVLQVERLHSAYSVIN